MRPERVRFQCGYALGDIVALTGAVRELHEQHPGAFVTDVETSAEEVWWFNPHITHLHSSARVIDCNQVCLDRDGSRGRHYISAYLDLINQQLGTSVRLRKIAGDIYLSPQEKDWYSDVHALCGSEIPFWIVCAGGKFDLTLKWWSNERYQKVIDHFRGRIQFVQVGSWGNYHPPLDGVIDLRGRTGIRDLIHLMYYARGVLCGVTSIMHLAAAVPTEWGGAREAVIVGGAREPAVWERYPGHRFITTEDEVGCARCWKHRHLTLIDRDQNFAPEIRCLNTSNDLPECMDRIHAERVIGEIESALARGPDSQLSLDDSAAGALAVRKSVAKNDFNAHNIHPLNAPAKAREFIERIPPYRGRFHGRGIVLCGGGPQYFANAWVCINMLRFHGCTLPIEFWHLGRHEVDREMEALLVPLGVRCVNAREWMNRFPMRNPLGWELKSYALLHSRFEQVLLLDSDNVPVRNPEFLFETPQFAQTGAIFWPDYRRLDRQRAIWKLCGVEYRDEPEFESGQMVIDKKRAWAPLNLAFWYNDHSEFFYQHIHGDKETFHMAWRRLEAPYAMVPHPIETLPGTMCQHDFIGRRLFQHRNLAKWSLHGENERVPGFLYENECLAFLERLRALWGGRIRGRAEMVRRRSFSFRKGTSDEAIYLSVTLENEYQLPAWFEPQDVILDIGAHIGSFAAACHARGSRSILCYEAHPENARLARANLRAMRGIAVRNKPVLHAEMPVDISPFPPENRGLNTGGSVVRPADSGDLRAVALDKILRNKKSVRLLKLDCEGSEWPILLHSRELHRVEEICGEFHEEGEHPLCPGFAALDRCLLESFLRLYFPSVRTQLDKKNPKLGKFWASRTKPVDTHELRQFSGPVASPVGEVAGLLAEATG